jgi:hypothetical protein
MCFLQCSHEENLCTRLDEQLFCLSVHSQKAHCIFESLSLEFCFYLVIKKYQSQDCSVSIVPGIPSLGAKQPGPEADHSHVSSAKVKNGAAVPPLPHMPSWRGA